MSVDDVKRVNDLAQQLLLKGIASDRVQAVRQAEQMLNKHIASPASVEPVSNNDMEGAKVVIQRNKEYMERQLSQFRQEINALAADVHDLRKQITELTVNSRIARQEASSLSLPSSRQEVQAPLSSSVHQVPTPQKPVMTGPAATHPRMGRWKSEDVQIEKMFYYGNK